MSYEMHYEYDFEAAETIPLRKRIRNTIREIKIRAVNVQLALKGERLRNYMFTNCYFTSFDGIPFRPEVLLKEFTTERVYFDGVRVESSAIGTTVRP